MKQVITIMLITVAFAFAQVIVPDTSTVIGKKQIVLLGEYNIVLSDIQTKTAELSELKIKQLNLEHTIRTLEEIK